MTNYVVGYGKPPKASRFKTGVSGNPKGRPKREAAVLAEIIGAALSAPMQYHEQGRSKTTTRHELSLRVLVERAVNGDLKAAEFLLVVRSHAQRHGEVGVDRLRISDWLPDYPGQTAEQKTSDFTAASEADPLKWWEDAESQTPLKE